MQAPEAKKGLGQHWLSDADSLQAMCDSAGVTSKDHVLEIGPGTGLLTEHLVATGAQITALEYDTELLPALQQKFTGENIKIEHGDIRTYNLTKLPKNYKIVANIPYYLTAYLLRLLTETSNQPEIAALLVQKEVAQRVASQPGQMSFISVATQLYYSANLGWVVPARLFSPPPKVDSQILILEKRSKPLFNTDYRQLLKFVKAGFAQPRKTLANNLESLPNWDRERVEAALNRLNLASTARAQELSLKDWHNLYILQ